MVALSALICCPGSPVNREHNFAQPHVFNKQVKLVGELAWYHESQFANEPARPWGQFYYVKGGLLRTEATIETSALR